ncbi:bifunctional 5,10-methylene-tetrahydrofolate dehydrogenase/5,10-methylene-tetrahydrofolate cyclohydrolase [Phenylobacterium sp. Root77]|uniref:bifunctional methylenetetrahydrofolate dehydrogenase/methenyltetrahydrofolate cyclohydrolase FolD n=1 Tax=unclassified Phenylobacterium TaxID=2640670 RepID=UPI000701B6DC|nr:MULTISPECIES: bifunctional methylenetetrahydrofolate dehydrogenase/methenyltetrahydrofolate cyclohydrolase FolD [unclassified Phenylobacterium]KQW72101.1 bifunctional 5,10-methylene-tetrahydrofolate dehydrogenase/5,10-methylene-tetrahydrofolate cyclohydrolase [Phenylobacterium sp. Root1277]KQW95021.1 bifunctional 5,10-methylene-tetrahydrofolate dehydrogenase/5,10-methylene-tetrahydrofolate cyclohydrolase [Phenylobacterium sp. Root1290]KRC44714.1 bifunctional 5,10-methylene-tetrahydrofolate de
MSQAQIIDGKVTAERLRAEVAKEVAALKAQHGLQPGLAVVLVGEDPASQVYVRSKGEHSKAAGMHSVTHRLPADVSEDELLGLVRQLNADPAIHGILVQLPLPKGLDEKAIIETIDPNKDVDGLHVVNAGRLAQGLPSLVPCTPLGCMTMLRETLGDLSGKRAVVIGRSVLVGKPVAQLLLQADCTVTVAHSRTQDLAAVCREADILVAAVGRPQMVKADWIKPGATVIDVGINRVPFRDPVKAAEGKTKLVGDVAYKEALAVAGHITPVPGGVGLMTVACLLQNTVTAAKRIAGVA